MVSLSPKRRSGVLSLAAAAAATLYVVMAFVAEPAGSLAATDDQIDVDVTIASSIALDCGSSVSLGTLAAGSSLSGSVVCQAQTNNPTGYTLKWKVPAGSGSANTCDITGVNNCGYGTGHLNSYRKDTTTNNGYAGYRILTFWPATPSHNGTLGTPATFNSVTADEQVRWAGRLEYKSTTKGGSGAPDFDVDSDPKYLNVGTGAYYNITKSTTATAYNSGNYDQEYLNFRVVSNSAMVTPASTYKTRVFVTIVDN